MIVIPRLRAMLARELVIQKRMTQSEIASLLGVSQPSISNYITGARGSSTPFLDTPEIIAKIREIVADEANISDRRILTQKLNELTGFIRKNRLMCEMHRQIDQDVEIESCHICDEGIS